MPPPLSQTKSWSRQQQKQRKPLLILTDDASFFVYLMLILALLLLLLLLLPALASDVGVGRESSSSKVAGKRNRGKGIAKEDAVDPALEKAEKKRK